MELAHYIITVVTDQGTFVVFVEVAGGLSAALLIAFRRLVKRGKINKIEDWYTE